MKKIAALIAALIATVAFAAPAQAAVPSNDSDVRLALTLGKMAWVELDSLTQSELCQGWYETPGYIRNEMAKILRNNYPGYISVYDSKRAAYRLMNWAC
jgi:hypothetical protein